jgi:hypothetical protein
MNRVRFLGAFIAACAAAALGGCVVVPDAYYDGGVVYPQPVYSYPYYYAAPYSYYFGGNLFYSPGIYQRPYVGGGYYGHGRRGHAGGGPRRSR